MMKRHSFDDLEVLAKVVIIIFIYVFLAMVTKPYGDPFTVIKTSQNIELYGFPFDPVSRSARAPFYYYLLFMVNEHYMFLQSLIAAIDVILLAVIALRLRTKPSIFSFMLPGLYVLLTRTYVDSLTVTLLSLLVLLSLSSLKAKTLSPNTYATILTSFLLVLTRESMLLLPLLALVILVLQQSTMPRRKLLTFIVPLILGWGLGCLTYYLYVYGVGATTYSSYGLYNVRLEDFLVAYTYVFSSIIPWEVKDKDLSQYLFFIKLPGIAYTYLVFIVRAFIVMLELLISMPFIVGLIELFRVRRKDLYYATAFSFIVYGIIPVSYTHLTLPTTERV